MKESLRTDLEKQIVSLKEMLAAKDTDLDKVGNDRAK